jgi:hypothetical protein
VGVVGVESIEDRDRRADLVVGALLDQLIRLSDDPLVQSGDQPEALGDVEERGGRDQVVVLLEHS